MAISLVGTSTPVGANANTSTLTLTIAAGVAQNDLALCQYGSNDAGNLQTTSSGWTTSTQTARGNLKARYFYKVQGSTPDSTIDFSISTGGGGNAHGATGYVFRDVDTSTPIDVTATTANAASGAPDPPSITPVTDNSLTIAFGIGGISDSSVTAPSGFGDNTLKAQTLLTVAMAVRSTPVSPAAANNPGAWTSWSSAVWASMSISLRPAVASGSGDGSASGTGSATAVGSSIAEANGTAAGVGAAAASPIVNGSASGQGAATASPVVVGSASGVGAASAVSVSAAFAEHWLEFPVTRDVYLHTNASPATNNALGTLALWYQHDGHHTAFLNAFVTSLTSGTRAIVQWVNGQGLEIHLFDGTGKELRTSSPLDIAALTSGAIDPEDGLPHWFGIGWDTNQSAGNKVLQVNVDGTQITVAKTDSSTAFSVNWTSCIDMAVGANWDPAYSDGWIAAYYFNVGAKIDFSSPTNVAKFYNAGSPVDLGADGSTPTGSAPTAYYSARTGDNVAAFLNNRGTGLDLIEVDLGGGVATIGSAVTTVPNGIAIGTSTATAVGKSTATANGSASGSSTALAKPIVNGAAAGVGSASGVLSALAAAVGASAGVASVLGAGAGIVIQEGNGTSIGTSSASAVGSQYFFYLDDDPSVDPMYSDDDPSVPSMYTDNDPVAGSQYTDNDP